MGESREEQERTPANGPASERLDSWKEIAAYLDRDVTTAIRWEKAEGLPVHRHLHKKLASVYAYRFEVDAWLVNRRPGLEKNGLRPQLASLWQDKKAVGVIGLGAGLLLLTGSMGWIPPVVLSTDRSAAPLVTKFSISVPATPPLVRAKHSLAISPDGRHVVYLGHNASARQLYLRALNEAEAEPIPGTEGASHFPFFSPDGQSVGFFADGELKRVSLNGGPQITLCYAGVVLLGGSWNAMDTIVFAAGPKRSEMALYRVSAGGGDPEIVATPDPEKGGTGYNLPKFLPGGKALLFDVSDQIRVLSLQTGEQKVLVDGGSNAYYAPTGHLVYQRREALLAAPFDLGRLEVTSNAAPVLDHIRSYAIAEDGTLLSFPAEWPASSLVWVDREGMEKLVTEDKQNYFQPRLSPDGTRLAITIIKPRQGPQVWIYDLENDSFRQLTDEGKSNGHAVWTPDGQWITFASDRDGSNNLYRQRADGRSGAERLTTSQTWQVPFSWSPDGSVLAFHDRAPERKDRDIWLLAAMGATPKPQPFISSPQSESGAHFSPDGEWLAYSSAELSPGERPQSRVYVFRYSEPDIKWLVPGTEGSRSARWSADGSELFFKNSGKMMVVSIQTQPIFQAGSPKVLFDVKSYMPAFDISPDGQRFLMIRKEKEDCQINVVLNWFEELKRLVPVNTG